jgi:NAD(P)-dependent dehydrogenase (short-subunit alcohol dehydrogenase family)
MAANFLNGKSLIITGASQGLGRALTLELARYEVDLVINAREAIPLEEVAQQCAQLGAPVSPVAGNAALAETLRHMVQLAKVKDNFYGFIHAAGVLHPGPFIWNLSSEHFQEIFESHVIAAYQLIHQLVPELLRRGEGGLALFIGSAVADYNIPGLGAYNAAKAAEEHLARQLAAETEEIISFIYRPGVIDTRMQAEARQARGDAGNFLRDYFLQYQAQGVLRAPEDVAKVLIKIITENPRQWHGKIVN